jgi:hypothetical protein
MACESDTGERLVLAILAAQAAVLRDGAETDPSVELLWRTTDVLSRLSGLLLDITRRYPALDVASSEACLAAMAEEVEVSRALDGLAFLQAQKLDFTRQMADCVVLGLQCLSSGERDGAPFSAHDLAALYVSKEQREVHDAAVRAFHAGPAGDHEVSR